MADDATGILTENLLASAAVRLFGRPFAGLVLGDVGGDAHIDTARGPILARIYGYSYTGGYARLAQPTVFLVYGEGTAVPAGTGRVPVATLGAEAHDAVFAEGVRMWASHDIDISVRIDITVGRLSDILIGAEADTASASDDSLVGRAQVVGRAQMIGRAQMVGRAQMIGRPPGS